MSATLAGAVAADDLRRLELLARAPEDEVRRFAAAGARRRLAAGEVLRQEGDRAEHVFVLLEGQVRISRQVEGRDELLTTYAAPALFGELPLLMGKTYFFGTMRAISPAEVAEFPAAAFWDLVTGCPEMTTAVLRQMAVRLRALETIAFQRARLTSLSTLAAGLAHELNNPASAVQRAAAEMQRAALELEACAAAAGRLLRDDQLDALRRLRDALAAASPAEEGALARTRREDDCAAWLEARGVGDAWSLAGALADAGVDGGRLDAVAAIVPPEAVDCAVRWLEAGLRAASLARTASDGADRVARTVGQVRGWTSLDHAGGGELDVRTGLDASLEVLAPRLRGVRVERAYADALPPVNGWLGELNQVWSALLENAADALEGSGTVRISTAAVAEDVCVRVEDDGPGIPAAVQPRVFDPFFTTRDVGRAGLGLATAWRIVAAHGGTLGFTSEPGRTVFEVRLPAA